LKKQEDKKEPKSIKIGLSGRGNQNSEGEIFWDNPTTPTRYSLLVLVDSRRGFRQLTMRGNTQEKSQVSE